jgi:Na+-driven multidrug efflux pump
MWAGQFVLLLVIAELGVGSRGGAIFAAHFVGIRVVAVTYLPAVAWGAAAATLVGQSLGAGDPRRAVQSGHEATLQCALLAVLISLVFYFGAGEIYRLMHRDPAVWAVGVGPFRLVAFFQVPLVLSIVYISALHGAGDTVSPLVITAVGVLLVRLPVAYLCGIVLDGGLFGAWLGMCADMALRAVLAAMRFVRGRWLRTQV